MKRLKSLGNPIEKWVISDVFILYIKPMKGPRLELSQFARILFHTGIHRPLMYYFCHVLALVYTYVLNFK